MSVLQSVCEKVKLKDKFILIQKKPHKVSIHSFSLNFSKCPYRYVYISSVFSAFFSFLKTYLFSFEMQNYREKQIQNSHPLCTTARASSRSPTWRQGPQELHRTSLLSQVVSMELDQKQGSQDSNQSPYGVSVLQVED